MSDLPTTPAPEPQEPDPTDPAAAPDEPTGSAAAAAAGDEPTAPEAPTTAGVTDAPEVPEATATAEVTDEAAALTESVAPASVEPTEAGSAPTTGLPRGPRPEAPDEPGWWMASDRQWYPPESRPTSAPAAPAGPAPTFAAPVAPPLPGTVPTAAAPAAYGYPGGVMPPGKSRVAAGLLGIFLGGFGVHRFYLGYTNIGIVQILVTVFTCGLGSIWGLVEGIMILVKSPSFLTDAQGVPLTD